MSGCFGTIDKWHLKRGEIPRECDRQHCLSFKKCWEKSFENTDLEFVEYRTDYKKDWSREP